MDGFTVELDRLSELVAMVGSAADQIGAATGRLREAGESRLGHEDLDSAGQEFQERWEHGVSRLREATQQLAPALGAARQQYANQDSVHAIRLGELTTPLGEPPDAGGQGAGSPAEAGGGTGTGGQAAGSPTDSGGSGVGGQAAGDPTGSIGRRLDGGTDHVT
ncbi:hypothetical protein [Actinophytocola sp.]|uniref:hypothetical protein n=1 Tax=Actinophytocola sp. TaxID=1872138 RepID=UPI003D6C3906